ARNDDAVEGWKHVLALEPAAAGAALELAARVFPDAERRAVEVPSLLAARLHAAEGRPEAVAPALRPGGAGPEGPRRPGPAQRAFSDGARVAAGYTPLREGLDRVARRSDDATAQLHALDRESQDTESPEQRFALDIAIGERLERGALSPERAAERYRHA